MERAIAALERDGGMRRWIAETELHRGRLTESDARSHPSAEEMGGEIAPVLNSVGDLDPLKRSGRNTSNQFPPTRWVDGSGWTIFGAVSVTTLGSLPALSFSSKYRSWSSTASAPLVA